MLPYFEELKLCTSLFGVSLKIQRIKMETRTEENENDSVLLKFFAWIWLQKHQRTWLLSFRDWQGDWSDHVKASFEKHLKHRFWNDNNSLFE